MFRFNKLVLLTNYKYIYFEYFAINNAIDNQIIWYKSLSSVIDKIVAFKPLIGNNSHILY